ncbi:hypothetical protein H0H92_009101 [Tricholoma furcatifolium]|nr:hypothetical protein H0H92_009101 [Tricholoma furcatifolium]
MALPTNGRVIVETTETPKACRNFLALAMEGYYDGVIFHRVVPGFLVQTGDKTGTGAGGESFYGEPFEDEIHPRLRFAHRGLVAMANAGTRHSNDSQFIITLELDKEGRPVYPPKIKTIRIVDNPFDDIVPRITAAEKRAQQRAKEESQREREEMERRKGAKKNVKLLSFGADEGGEEEEPVIFQKKSIYRPDLEDVEPSVSQPDFVTQKKCQPPKRRDQETPSIPAPKADASAERPSRKKDKEDSDILNIRQRHAQEQAAHQSLKSAEIEKMEADIRKLRKRRDGEDSDDEHTQKKAKKSYLQEELDKYAKGRGMHKKGKRKDEGDVLAVLNSFRSKLQTSAPMSGDDEDDVVPDGDEGMEIDDDRGFMNHALHFPKDDGEESRKAERDYEVIDPRQRGARAKEEERERKRLAKARGGGGGRRR